MRILLVIQHLNQAGAERQIVNLAKGLASRGHDVVVAVFKRGGALESELAADGVPIVGLSRLYKLDIVGLVWSLVYTTRRFNADVVYSFLGAANIVAALAKLSVRDVPLLMGIRASNMDICRYGLLPRLQYFVEPWFARLADLIVANSVAGARHAVAVGFPAEFVRVCHNGIDVERFKPERANGRDLRHQWGIGRGDILIGVVGRRDPMKGLDVFLRAVVQLAALDARLRFVIIGDVCSDEREWLRGKSCADKVIWAGRRDDMSVVMNALDVFCSASRYGEGFSNALAEAMASGVPCVATDVGDAALILGEVGEMARPDDVADLVAALGRLLARRDTGEKLGEASRMRIVEQFTLARLVMKTERLLHESLD